VFKILRPGGRKNDFWGDRELIDAMLKFGRGLKYLDQVEKALPFENSSVPQLPHRVIIFTGRQHSFRIKAN
jgi:hypothetical protein